MPRTNHIRHPTVTEYGVRHMIPKLAKTIEECPLQCSCKSAKISQTILLRTADNHKLELCLRERRNHGCETQETGKTTWQLELSFDQWAYDEEDDEEKRDDDFCDAFAAYIGGAIGNDTLYMASMTEDMKSCMDKSDVVPRVAKILQKAIAAELCGCSKQIVAQNEEICFNCMLGLEAPKDGDAQANEMSCPICMKLMSKHSPLTSCCGKMSHVRCLRNCNGKCPFCRTEPFTYA